jgi:FAD/FMN-containing dehydrogenase
MKSLSPSWHALQDALAGEVVLPGSPGYESVSKPAIARFHDARPRAVVRCETPEDVSETILFARRSGLETSARSGGHCFAGHSSTEGIVIDVRPMRSLSVSGTVATVGAGARLGEVYDALDVHGLTLPAGCGPSVGISGLALGGGLGISSAASTGSPPTTCWEPRWSWQTAASWSAMGTTKKTCSGRCVARAAATSVSLPP